MFVALLIALVASSTGQKPEFDAPFRNVTLEPGFQQHLNCKAKGEKPITYKWYNQNEEQITTNDTKQPIYIRNLKSYSDSDLFFKRPSSQHEGSYTCTASNAHGLASKVFLLTVSPPSGLKPKFDVPIQNVTKESGRFQWLRCRAEGEKPLTYKWYNQHGDELTGQHKNFSITITELYSDLNFKNLSTEQKGLYKCTASNINGQASKVFSLRVSTPGDGNGTSLFRDAKVLKYTSKSVMFNITTSGPVKFIEVKYREGRRASNTTTIRLKPVSGNIYEIGNLLPSGLYSFQFRTVPPDSNKWSKEYNLTLLPDSPEIVLESTYNQTIKLKWFTKKDDLYRGTIDKHQIKYFPVKFVDGNGWYSTNCSVTIEIPTCVGSSYTIWGLERSIFYQIEVRAHTKAGYGEPWRQKIYLP